MLLAVLFIIHGRVVPGVRVSVFRRSALFTNFFVRIVLFVMARCVQQLYKHCCYNSTENQYCFLQSRATGIKVSTTKLKLK